jgi:hypothetical protein
MKTSHLSRLLFILMLVLPLPAISQDMGSLVIRSTSLVERTAVGGNQICIAEVQTPDPEPRTLELTFTGVKPMVLTSDFAGKTVRFSVPVISVATPVKAVLKKSGKIITETTAVLQPPKKWKVYDVQVSHHDLGYADYYHMMRRDVREWGIEMALDFCRRTDSWPEESRFHWTVETSEPMTGFLQYQPDSVIEELTRRIKEGRIDLGALHNSVSTEHMSYEVLARAFYTPNRYIVDWMGIPPSKTALDTDVVGFVRSLPLYTKEADIPYFMMGVNHTVQAFDQAFRDAAWWWKAPDNDPRMTLFKTWPY